MRKVLDNIINDFEDFKVLYADVPFSTFTAHLITYFFKNTVDYSLCPYSWNNVFCVQSCVGTINRVQFGYYELAIQIPFFYSRGPHPVAHMAFDAHIYRFVS